MNKGYLSRLRTKADVAVLMGMQNLADIARTMSKTAPAAFAVLAVVGRVLADEEAGGGGLTTGDAAGRQMIVGVLNVLYIITNAVGIILGMIGFVSVVIARAEGDGPGQQKGAMMIGTGIALVALKPILQGMHPETWLLNTSYDGGGN